MNVFLEMKKLGCTFLIRLPFRSSVLLSRAVIQSAAGNVAKEGYHGWGVINRRGPYRKKRICYER